MDIKKILLNSFWYGVIPKFSYVVTILLLPFITPFLTLEDYGMIGIINSYKGIAIGIATFGLHMHLTNSFFELKGNFKLLWNRLFFYMFVTSFITSLCLAIVYIFTLPINSIITKIFIISASTIPVCLIPNTVIAGHYYVLTEQPKKQVITNLVGSLLSILTSFIIIRFFHYGYIGWVLGTSLSAIVVFVLFMKPLYTDAKIYPQVDFNTKRIKRLVKTALPIIPHNLGHILLSSSDRIVMSILGVSVTNIGLYTNGYQIGEIANTIIVGFFTALSPTIQKKIRAKDQKAMCYVYRLSILTISFFIFCCMMFMKEFYVIFIRNESMQPAYLIAIIICSGYLVSTSLYLFLSTSIFIKKDTHKILYLTFYPAILNLILNFVFIPVYGYMAAIYTSIISYWIIFLLPFLLPSFKERIKYMLGSRRVLIEGLVISIVVLLLAYFTYDFHFGIKVIVMIFMLLLNYSYYHFARKVYGCTYEK